MFEPIEIPSLSSWWWRYAAQVLLCYPAVLLTAIPFRLFPSLTGLGLHGGVYFAGYDCLGFSCLGAILGWIVGRHNPRFKSSGQWIWILPTIFLTSSIATSLQLDVPWLPEAFFASASNEGLGPYLVSRPAFGGLGYSIGMALSSRSVTPLPSLNVVLGFATVIVVGISAMRLFEEDRLARWSTVRSVIDQSMWISSDARGVCQSQKGEFPLRGVMLVSLGERRACNGDRVLEPGEAGPPGSFVVEHVRILTGPHRGVEGWVLDYGLSDSH